MTTVAVEIWSMKSLPGYRNSDGYRNVYMIPAVEATKLAFSETALLDYAEEKGDIITKEDIDDAIQFEKSNGALVYDGTRGTVDVPEGMVLVEVTYEYVSTRDSEYTSAEILNADSLRQHYADLAEKYARLANDAR